MRKILILTLLLTLVISSCSSPASDISGLQKQVQADQTTIKTLQTSDQQKTKDIAELKTALAAAVKGNTDLQAKLVTYATKDDLARATATQPPPANLADLLNRVSAAQGDILNLKSQAVTLQSQVTAAIRQNVDYIDKVLVDRYASKTDIATLQGQLNNLSAPAITDIISRTNTLTAQLVTAQQLITNLQAYGTQLSQLQTQINTLQSAANTIGALANQVSGLSSQVATLASTQSPAALIAAMQTMVANDQAMVNQMRGEMNVAQGNITNMQGLIGTLQGQVADIQNRLVSHGW